MAMLSYVEEIMDVTIALYDPTGKSYNFGPASTMVAETTGKSSLDLYSPDGNDLEVPFWRHPIIDIKCVYKAERSFDQIVLHLETPKDWYYSPKLAGWKMTFTLRGTPQQLQRITSEISERIAAFGSLHGLRWQM